MDEGGSKVVQVPTVGRTLYINNLNEKVRREELRQALYLLFSHYGTVLDVVATKNHCGRGQAFVVFRDVNDAVVAHRGASGYAFFGKPMRVAYARMKSDIVAKLDGTWTPQMKEDRHVRRSERRSRTDVKLAALAQRKKARESDDGADIGDVRDKGAPAAKRQRVDASVTSASRMPAAPVEPPNKILFVQNLPLGTAASTITDAFSSRAAAGFVEVRIVPGKTMAFVEYADEMHAASALSIMQYYELADGVQLVVSFAKK